MKVKTWIKYEAEYIPPRCRKPRYEERSEYIYPELKEISLNECELAFEDISYEGKGKIYLYDGNLWAKVKLSSIDEAEGYKTALEAFVHWKEISSNFFFFSWDRERGVKTSRRAVIRRVNKAFKNSLVIDGELYGICSEPIYVINTFGLGHNHGGTGMFVEYRYNPNISRESYFNALEGDKAVEYANKTAAGRGDTKDIGRFKPLIKVYKPELVKHCPAKEHGDGNKLLNDMEELTKSASSPFEAGLLLMAAMSAKIN